MAPSRRLGWAALLLAAAFPHAAHAVASALATVTVALLAHPTAVCAVAGGLLLVSAGATLRRRAAHARQIRAVRRLTRSRGPLNPFRLAFGGTEL
ncbi:hypothetical protein BX265_0870 [Streptomyces sp. TLI_235]|nr:hypothetical protein [Streptomyces sp. TLI_235]PBC76167.1 hypothetical protein BX265_0870 [Streptomyces sp. TLI_235]